MGLPSFSTIWQDIMITVKLQSARLQAVKLVIISNLPSAIALLHCLLPIISLDEGKIYIWKLR
jgi:hypothetical protein